MKSKKNVDPQGGLDFLVDDQGIKSNPEDFTEVAKNTEYNNLPLELMNIF